MPLCIYELTLSQTRHNSCREYELPFLAIGSLPPPTYLICSGEVLPVSPCVSFYCVSWESVSLWGSVSSLATLVSAFLVLSLAVRFRFRFRFRHLRNHHASPCIPRLLIRLLSYQANRRTGNREDGERTNEERENERDDKAKTRTQIQSNQSSHRIFARPPLASSSSPAVLI